MSVAVAMVILLWIDRNETHPAENNEFSPGNKPIDARGAARGDHRIALALVGRCVVIGCEFFWLRPRARRNSKKNEPLVDALRAKSLHLMCQVFREILGRVRGRLFSHAFCTNLPPCKAGRYDGGMVSECVADYEGPWVDPAVTTGLIERCKRYWNVAICQLPDSMVATYLNQQIATRPMIEEANRRITDGEPDGKAELYDGQLAEVLKADSERRSINLRISLTHYRKFSELGSPANRMVQRRSVAPFRCPPRGEH